MKGNSKERNGERLVLVVIFMLFLPLLFYNSSYNKLNQKPKSEEKNETSVPSSSSNISSTSTDDVKDPYKLSFSDHSYLTEFELRNRLSISELEYCSYVTENSINDLILTWNLKSSGNEVYRCSYTYDKKRDYSKRSMAACSISKGYQEYLDGDKALIRDYVMPEKDDQIEMFVYAKDSSYYDRYFILGRYSDMECYVKGEDIHFTYYWYQDTDEGPKLVYKSTAINYDTTSGQRYNDDLWESFERTYKNIKIIPYEDYPRDHDYLDDYRKWENKMRKKKRDEDLQAMREDYCRFSDAEELYYEYEGDFDSWESAYEFFDEYCN